MNSPRAASSSHSSPRANRPDSLVVCEAARASSAAVSLSGAGAWRPLDRAQPTDTDSRRGRWALVVDIDNHARNRQELQARASRRAGDRLLSPPFPRSAPECVTVAFWRKDDMLDGCGFDQRSSPATRSTSAATSATSVQAPGMEPRSTRTRAPSTAACHRSRRACAYRPRQARYPRVSETGLPGNRAARGLRALPRPRAALVSERSSFPRGVEAAGTQSRSRST
jgi:hypothetical protein